MDQPTKEQIANVRLLLELWATVPPERVDFELWYSETKNLGFGEPDPEYPPSPECGTFACLGGWANMLAPWQGSLSCDNDQAYGLRSQWTLSWWLLNQTFGTASLFEARGFGKYDWAILSRAADAGQMISDYELASRRMQAFLDEHDAKEAT
jgi:hypothetical protein